MMDAICQHYYGDSSGAVEQVYEANRGLADVGAVLPSGLVIDLPEIEPAVILQTVRLWD
jgi:phage tail protein X